MDIFELNIINQKMFELQKILENMGYTKFGDDPVKNADILLASVKDHAHIKRTHVKLDENISLPEIDDSTVLGVIEKE